MGRKLKKGGSLSARNFPVLMKTPLSSPSGHGFFNVRELFKIAKL